MKHSYQMAYRLHHHPVTQTASTQPLAKGCLIACEGIDGSGKTTFTQEFAKALSENFPVLLTKEPGGTPFGKEIRTLVHKREKPICPKAEYLLFAADRAQHIEEIVRPALQNGKVVVSDRFSDSSLVYQGIAGLLDPRMIELINRWVMNKIVPDIVIFLDIDVELAQQRVYARSNDVSHFEMQPKQFWEKIAQGFRSIFSERRNVLRLDSSQPAHLLVEKAILAITPFITKPHEANFVHHAP